MSLDLRLELSEEPLPLLPVKPRRPAGRWVRPVGRGLLVGVLIAVVTMTVAGGIGIVRSQRKDACRDRLRRLGLAFHRFQEARDRFPRPAIVGRDGRPLLSWRVAILPYLDGGEALFRAFRLDEPWDGPHNLRLVARMPALFACPSDPGRKAGMTPYRVIAAREEREGRNPMFMDGRGVEMLEVTDGSSNTILVAEASESVVWTRPDELRDDPGEPLPSFSSRHEGGFHVLFVDGAVRFLKTTTDPTILRTLITRDGGEVLSA